VTKRIVVTGCSSGIGEAAALRLARAGHPVYATVRAAKDAARLSAEVPTLVALRMDVTDDASVAAAARAVLADGGAPDVLVNNVGVPCLGSMEELAPDDLRQALEVNVVGALRVYQAFAPAMRARGTGHVINVSSSIGAAALPLYGGYCATKFALEAMSEAMRHELAPHGVAVNVLRPGIVRTPFAAKKAAQAPGRVPAGSPYAGRLDNPSQPDLMERVSTPEQVAEAIEALITQPGPPFRRTCGRDSRDWLEARAALDDEAFFAGLDGGGYAFRR
jgi:NAD(P)-dependent dehydrogenase (short-subunit alcohol dehydrogenase family)